MEILERPGLYTDLYELTMAQGYYLSGRSEERATFDYFFRDNPFDGGYVVFAGLGELLETLESLQFHQDELEYLREQGFNSDFLGWLKDFRFRGDILAAREGEIVFPVEPTVRVNAPVIEAQIIETLLLNILNFESLIATKAARITYAAEGRQVLDFGLRRSQGLGGLQASRAAAVGGVQATSNVYAARRYNIPPSGTMAHSWIQSFDDELTSFRSFAEHYPDNCILLVDTYDTLKTGVPNAIRVAKELEERGHRLKGIRLDSGDLAYFAQKSREMLDEAGLDYVKIAASNQLDERLIKSLITQDAPIDLFGVGTRLVTGHETPALDGVYKLSSINKKPKLKISENIEKVTLPGDKAVFRFLNGRDHFYGDGVVRASETQPEMIYHPFFPTQKSKVHEYEKEKLLQPVMKKGEPTIEYPTVAESHEYFTKRFACLNPEHKRFDNPHIYKVGISKELMDLRDHLMEEMKEKENQH